MAVSIERHKWGWWAVCSGCEERVWLAPWKWLAVVAFKFAELDRARYCPSVGIGKTAGK